ncbi:hypothetical protein [Mycoplasma struthionis]|uniref:Uncharacterized protein n=1 Tax=Mycoplasma struthionis TaxID=538220 RepID=A0A502M9Q5_9MOLU|nr:hypothetical protein [Mycoplasma struthionis]TPI02959.1 hypothetical protein FJM01_00200 [Mycoplasma struthionis]
MNPQLVMKLLELLSQFLKCQFVCFFSLSFNSVDFFINSFNWILFAFINASFKLFLEANNSATVLEFKTSSEGAFVLIAVSRSLVAFESPKVSNFGFKSLIWSNKSLISDLCFSFSLFSISEIFVTKEVYFSFILFTSSASSIFAVLKYELRASLLALWPFVSSEEIEEANVEPCCFLTSNWFFHSCLSLVSISDFLLLNDSIFLDKSSLERLSMPPPH